MTTDDPTIAHWVASYKDLAESIVHRQVQAMQAEFPDEQFPVRPPYRKAMYHRLLLLVDELNNKMNELLEESPDETDEALLKTLQGLQEGYEQAFIEQVRKVDPSKPDVATTPEVRAG
jgi:hypothetical protein